jgi:hypothetical protein
MVFVVKCASNAGRDINTVQFEDNSSVCNFNPQAELLRGVAFYANVYLHTFGCAANSTSFRRHKRYDDGPVNMEPYIPFLRYPSLERLSTDSEVTAHPHQPPAIITLTLSPLS